MNRFIRTLCLFAVFMGIFVVPCRANPHKAGFGGGMRLGGLGGLALNSSSSTGLTPSGFVDFRT